MHSKRFRFSFGAKKDRGTGSSLGFGRARNETRAKKPFFARSLTLVPRSLLLNRTETLGTQANPEGESKKILDQFRAKCWLRGGVGGQFPRNLN